MLLDMSFLPPENDTYVIQMVICKQEASNGLALNIVRNLPKNKTCSMPRVSLIKMSRKQCYKLLVQMFYLQFDKTYVRPFGYSIYVTCKKEK